MARRRPARYAAPVAFLAAVTVAVLLIRSGLDSTGSPARPAGTVLETRATTTQPEPATTASGTTTTPEEGETYVIQAGDTLDRIALRFGTTVERLLVLNPEVDPVSLQLGQTIRVE
jgi:LysM repeat protein